MALKTTVFKTLKDTRLYHFHPFQIKFFWGMLKKYALYLNQSSNTVSIYIKPVKHIAEKLNHVRKLNYKLVKLRVRKVSFL